MSSWEQLHLCTKKRRVESEGMIRMEMRTNMVHSYLPEEQGIGD